MSNRRMIELNRKINGVVTEGAMANAKNAFHAAKGFAKIEKNKEAMNALMAMRNDVRDRSLQTKFLEIIEKILSKNEYEAIKGMMSS